MDASRSLLSLASDERLTQEMRRGNEAAFEVAYGRYAQGMLGLCRHILGSRDEAEEALQHSFAAAWSDLQRPNRPAPVMLKPWLYAVARHRCLSMLRSRQPRTVELEEVPSTSGLADEVAQRADLRGLLADLHDLPEEQRTALVLSELAGLSHADIADVLGRQTSGVKALVFQARATLGDWREAREAPCAEIREQLSVLRGGSLRRRALRRHLQACTNCRAFRAELKAQRRRLAIVLPVLPSLGLKRGVLATVGLGAASGGGAAGGGAVGGGAAVGLGAPALVPLGSATVVMVAVVGMVAGSTLTQDKKERGSDQPTPLARSPAEHGNPRSPASTLGDAEDGAGPPRGRSKRNRRGPEKIAKANVEANEKIAKTNSEAKPKIAKANQEAVLEIGKANEAAARKDRRGGGEAGQAAPGERRKDRQGAAGKRRQDRQSAAGERREDRQGAVSLRVDSGSTERPETAVNEGPLGQKQVDLQVERH